MKPPLNDTFPHVKRLPGRDRSSTISSPIPYLTYFAGFTTLLIVAGRFRVGTFNLASIKYIADLFAGFFYCFYCDYYNFTSKTPSFFYLRDYFRRVI